MISLHVLIELEKASTRMKTKMLMSFKKSSSRCTQKFVLNLKFWIWNLNLKRDQSNDCVFSIYPIRIWGHAPYNKSFIDQASSVKMAGYWPRSLFAFLWISTSSRSIKMEKENSANIQPSWPRAWSIIHTYCSNLTSLNTVCCHWT